MFFFVKSYVHEDSGCRMLDVGCQDMLPDIRHPESDIPFPPDAALDCVGRACYIRRRRTLGNICRAMREPAELALA
jgi:hypothetical protein